MLSQAQWQAHKRAIVESYATPNDGRGWLQMLSVAAPVALLWFAIRQASTDSPWLVAAATVGLSLFMLRGFVLMHDCGHHSLFRSRRLNRIGGFLLGVLAGMPQQVWAENHRYHHVTNGNWAKYRGPLNVACVSDYLAMDAGQRRRYRYTRDILMAPFAGCLYFLVNPRVTWLRATWHLLRRRLTRARPQAGDGLPPGVTMAHYRYMTWNNLALLSAWGLMAWAIDPCLFFACYVISGSLAGGYGIVLFTVQHNFEHCVCQRGRRLVPRRRRVARHEFPDPAALAQLDHRRRRVPSCASPVRRRAELPARGLPPGARTPVRERHAHSACATFPRALKHVLWDLKARRLVSVAEAMGQAAP